MSVYCQQTDDNISLVEPCNGANASLGEGGGGGRAAPSMSYISDKVTDCISHLVNCNRTHLSAQNSPYKPELVWHI